MGEREVKTNGRARLITDHSDLQRQTYHLSTSTSTICCYLFFISVYPSSESLSSKYASICTVSSLYHSSSSYSSISISSLSIHLICLFHFFSDHLSSLSIIYHLRIFFSCYLYSLSTIPSLCSIHSLSHLSIQPSSCLPSICIYLSTQLHAFHEVCEDSEGSHCSTEGVR